jgi:anti-anti-sigma factor
MSLTLKTRHSGTIYIIQCAGSIIYGEEESSLDAALDHAEHGFSRIVLDLSGVVRLDSMGLGLLVRHQVRLAKRGGAIHLAGSPAFVIELLDLTKCFIVLPNFASEEEAIASFLKRAAAQVSEKRGSRLLVFDPSPDLCTFARTVLSQHGFDVRTSCAFGDAKLLLRVHGVDYVLVGPCNSQLPAADAARDLAEIAPRASVVRLSSDFKSRDALEATEQLLRLFGLSGASSIPG